jgi:hypothetical protein
LSLVLFVYAFECENHPRGCSWCCFIRYESLRGAADSRCLCDFADVRATGGCRR